MLSVLLGEHSPLEHVVQQTAPEWVMKVGEISITLMSNHIFMQIVSALLIVLIVPWALRRRNDGDETSRLVPRGLGNAIEAVCEFLRKNIFEPNLGKYTDIFAPYLWSLFFFILVQNALGMIPLSEWFKAAPNHVVGGTATGNVFVTATLAILTLILMVGSGLRYHGMAYVQHFFMGPAYIAWFIAILEIAGLVFKTLALCVRLFANMLAGHIIIAVLMSFIPAVAATMPMWGVAGITTAVVLGAVAFNLLEIIIVVPLHAFIFTTLTAVFIGLAVNIHHDDEHEELEHAAAHAGGHH